MHGGKSGSFCLKPVRTGTGLELGPGLGLEGHIAVAPEGREGSGV